MKPFTWAALIFVAALLPSSPTFGQTNAESSFEKLKSLEGTWSGSGGPEGQTRQIDVHYEIVSGGQAVVETRVPENEASMVTVFHLDGDKLMMTHYCSAGNQPRMKAETLQEGTLSFTLLDVTNLADPSDGHMKGLAVDFVGDTEVRQKWIWHEAGNNHEATFILTREL